MADYLPRAIMVNSLDARTKLPISCAMIWADRVALLWAILLICAIIFLQGNGGFAHSLEPDNIMGGWGQLLLKLVVAPWAFLRFIDLILGGPARRSGRFIVRRL